MKLSVSSPTLNFNNPPVTKPVSSTNNTDLNLSVSNPISNNNTNNLGYEPTSVLDLERSPSPAFATENNHYNHYQQTWDSILTELGLNDDNSNNNLLDPDTKPKLLISNNIPDDNSFPFLTDFPPSQQFDHTPSDFPDLSYTPSFEPSDQQHQQNSTKFGVDFLDELLRAAHAFESNDSHTLHLILSRLNQRLRSPTGKPLHRAAFYFKEALQHLYTNPTQPDKRLSSYDIVQTIHTTKLFSNISPISLFSAFTANQAILEAVEGATFIHIIDFEVGFGGQWASFMRELVDKADKLALTTIVLRITAIIPEEFSVESILVSENLTQFATELNLNFHIDFIFRHTFETLSFRSIKFINGERIAVHLSPSTFHHYTTLVSDLNGLSPTVVVVVDREVGVEFGAVSFRENFVAGIEYYTGVLESLDVAGAGECVRKIETYVVQPRVMAVVEEAAGMVARQNVGWREAVVAAGMTVLGFSQFADFQAECLLRRAQVGGFHVVKRRGEMMLCWHDRPLVATSAWKFQM